MAGKTLTSSLVVRLIDKVSGPARGAAKALLGLNKAAAGGSFGQRLSVAIDRNNAALDRARGGLVDAVAGFYALKTAIGSPVKAAMEFESAMADVRKVVDFPTPKAFKDFQAQLVELSKTVPLSVNGLAQIAAAAGQAGIAGDDIIRFTEAAAKIGVAFDISADQAGDAMAKLMTGLGITIDEAVLLTDSINHLSNAQASSAAEILDVVRRVGAQSKQFGFTATQVSAFASAMISSGAESEVAATSFRNMGMALTRGSSATKRQNDAFKKLGLNSKKVAKAMQTDAVGTTVKVLEKIAQLPKETQAAISSDLFGNEARALGPLLTNLQLVRDSLGLVDDQAKYAGSSFKEFGVRAKTFENAVQTFGNRMTALKIVIGAALIPALNDLMDRLAPIVEAITDFAQANPELTRNVLAAAAGVVAFKAAMAGLTFVGLLGKGGALTMLSIGFNTVGKAAIGAARGAGGMIALQRALAAMSGARYTGLAVAVDALKGMALAVPGVAAIGSALGAIGGALAAISAPAWVAIGAGVAVVAGAGALLWKYWDRISSVVSGVARRIGEELQPVFEHFAPAIEPVKIAVKALGDGFSWAGQKIGEFASWIGSFFQREILSDEQAAGFEQAGYKVADAMINAIKSAFNGLLEWFKSLPGKIVDAIGSIDISGLIKWPSLPSWAGGGSSEPSNDNKTPAVSGHRAKGGNVWPGGSFLVGDGGEEEIFRPKTAGTITPVSKSSPSIGQIGPFHIQGAGDPEAVADRVAKKVEDRINRLLRGAHADMGAR